MKTLAKITILTAAALLGVAAFAAGPGMRARLTAELGLTQQQQEQLTLLRQKHQKEAMTLRHQIEERQLALKQEMEKEHPSEAAVFKAIDEVAPLRVQMLKMQFRQRQAMQAVLTPEQLERLRALRDERRERRGQERGGQGRRPARMSEGPAPGDGPSGEMDDDFPQGEEWAGEVHE